MDNSLHLKYLVVSPLDLKWGLAVNSVGYQEIARTTLPATCSPKSGGAS